jgi:tetratricopeptide (TPR) repeat protein
MYQRELSKLPGAVVNTAIDSNGFIYTVTKEIKNEQVKKFNIAGLNQLEAGGEFTPAKKKRTFGENAWWAPRGALPQLQDLSVDADGNLTVIDALYNAISQYDADGNLLFFWGSGDLAETTKLGLVKTPAAIATTANGDLLVLDSVNSLIQRLRLTEFGSLVHQANRLTQDGKYEESEPLWSEVYRQNAFYTPALVGLAKAAFKKEQFDLAEELFYKAGVNKGYSDSFWQNRLVWFQNRFGLLMNIVIAVGVAVFAFGRLSRRYAWAGAWYAKIPLQAQFFQQLKHAGTLVKHPIDGYHAIRYQGRAGLASSLTLLTLAIVALGLIRSQTSFVFNTDIYKGVKLGPILIQFITIWVGWVIAHYLVSSLMRGEGRLRDVFYGSSYALIPIIAIGIPLTVISHGFTLSEASIFNFMELAMYLWTLLQFFWMVQGIQNYTVGEAILNIIFSLLALAIIATLIFIFISLSGELINFIYSIYQEVIIR